MFKLYKTHNSDSLPSESGCLGKNNVDTNANGTSDCDDNGATVVNTALHTKLETVGIQPDVITQQITGTDNIKRAGILYSGSSGYITWFLNDATSCGINGATLGRSGPPVYCMYNVSLL